MRTGVLSPDQHSFLRFWTRSRRTQMIRRKPGRRSIRFSASTPRNGGGAMRRIKKASNMETLIRKSRGFYRTCHPALWSSTWARGPTNWVYQIFSFDTPEWRRSYAPYKKSVKYGDAYSQIEGFLSDLPPGALVVDLGAGANQLGLSDFQLRHPGMAAELCAV